MKSVSDIVIGCSRDAELLQIRVRSLSASVHLVETHPERPSVKFLCHTDIVVRYQTFLQEIAEVVLMRDERNRNTLAGNRIYRTVLLYRLEISARSGRIRLVEFRSPCPQSVIQTAAFAVTVGILAVFTGTVDSLLLRQRKITGSEHRR